MPGQSPDSTRRLGAVNWPGKTEKKNPMIPADLSLSTGKANLRPLCAADFSSFLQLARADPDMWYYFLITSPMKTTGTLV